MFGTAPRSATVLAVLTLALAAGCGGNDGSGQGSPARPGSAGSGLARSGDAATNPACALLRQADVEQVIDGSAKLVEINGTVTHGRYGADSHNCFWITDTGSGPWAVAVNLEQDLGPARDAAASDVRGGLELGGTSVDGLGDVAVTAAAAVRTVFGDQYLMVQVGTDDASAGSDEATQHAVSLARTALRRMK